MSQKFQASVHHRDDVSYVKLAGVIDEDNELTSLTDKIPAGTAVIDLGEIERINSCGVRDWVNWLTKLEGQATKAVLVECSPAIVAQINLVNNFTGSGVVKSFYVPYFCPDCDEEKVLLDCTAHENVAAAVMAVYDSQICGGKRYDLATAGRRKAQSVVLAAMTALIRK